MKRAHVGPTIEHYMIKLKAPKDGSISKYFQRKPKPTTESTAEIAAESSRDAKSQSEPSKSQRESSKSQEKPTEQKGAKQREARRDIAAATLDAIKHGSYLQHDLSAPIAASKQGTRYYGPDSNTLSAWATSQPSNTYPSSRVSLLEISTIEGCRFLASNTPSSSSIHPRKLALLNFASAKKPGGGFLSGAQAQEESIARSSTLYPTLMTATGQKFYTLHNKDPQDGVYSHAMIYSPGVLLIRDDGGSWLDFPVEVDVLTSPAVNAGVVMHSKKRTDGQREREREVESVMRERMARILYLYEIQAVQDLVLGSFGTGVFQNDVGMVARIWAELLLEAGARFEKSFDNVVFAVLGSQTFGTFQEVFGRYGVS
ncbi:hypothetical protein BDY19DRAFT_303757 [Irpex rosettiformis]|uniref:Uncharacterized protein n=1 Tax=Irpex rosettiformis TaxID=378272 RepID=A0ACB8TYQ7_9APHY|nr:hypothetical protein BDY19DRAFT_303757 [Irpex rosettiformis]